MSVCIHGCMPQPWGLCPGSTIIRGFTAVGCGLVATERFLFADIILKPGSTRQNDTNFPIFKDGLSELGHFTFSLLRTHTSKLLPSYTHFLKISIKFPNKRKGERSQPSQQL